MSRIIEVLFHIFYCNFGRAKQYLLFLISRTSSYRGSLNRGSTICELALLFVRVLCFRLFPILSDSSLFSKLECFNLFRLDLKTLAKKPALWICHCLIHFLLSFYFILSYWMNYMQEVSAKKVITKTKLTCFLWKVIVFQSLKEKSRLANNSMFLSS